MSPTATCRGGRPTSARARPAGAAAQPRRGPARLARPVPGGGRSPTLADLGRPPDRACRRSPRVWPRRLPATAAPQSQRVRRRDRAAAGTRTGPGAAWASAAAAPAYLPRLLPALADAGVLSARTTADGGRGLRAAARPRAGPIVCTTGGGRTRSCGATPAREQTCTRRRRSGTGSRAPATAAPAGCGAATRSRPRPGLQRRLLPAAVPGAGVPGGHRRAHRPAYPGRARTVEDGVPTGRRYTRPERAVLHPHAGDGHRHRRPVRRGARLAAAGAGQLRPAGRPRRPPHRQRAPADHGRPQPPRPLLPDRAAGDDRRQILPPGCYLSAVEILRRQYLAHLLDLAARGALPGVLPLPRRTSLCSTVAGSPSPGRRPRGATGWSRASSPSSAAPGVDAAAHRDCGSSPPPGCSSGRRGRAGVRPAWRTCDRLTASMSPRAVLPGDPTTRNCPAAKAERGRCGAGSRVAVRRDAHGTLVEFGLLPNYALTTPVPRWRRRCTGRTATTPSTPSRDSRPSAHGADRARAGQHLLRRGYKHEISGLDIGTAARPCGSRGGSARCGYVRTHRPGGHQPLPRCGSGASPTTAAASVLPPTGHRPGPPRRRPGPRRQRRPGPAYYNRHRDRHRPGRRRPRRGGAPARPSGWTSPARQRSGGSTWAGPASTAARPRRGRGCGSDSPAAPCAPAAATPPSRIRHRPARLPAAQDPHRPWCPGRRGATTSLTGSSSSPTNGDRGVADPCAGGTPPIVEGRASFAAALRPASRRATAASLTTCGPYASSPTRHRRRRRFLVLFDSCRAAPATCTVSPTRRHSRPC